jgi:hypothetical protein
MSIALLLYSNNCKHSRDLLNFLQQTPQFNNLITFHDVNRLGVPPQYKQQIRSVPTMLTKNGKLLVGGEIKQWLTSLMPCELSNFSFQGRGGGFGSSLDDDDDCDLFSLDSYGQSLQPAMTPELEQKINQNVSEAYNTNKR